MYTNQRPFPQDKFPGTPPGFGRQLRLAKYLPAPGRAATWESKPLGSLFQLQQE